jgi:murein DD-endopeptidase MepM/ murein hydrolase activator NlpD
MEIRFALTGSADVAFGISLRIPRRRARSHDRLRRWTRVVATAALCVFAAASPVATVVLGTALPRAADGLRSVPTAVTFAVADTDVPARPFVRARGSLTTTVSDDAPALRAHVVTAGETLFSIGLRYGIAPQTLAFNNGIVSTGDLRIGQSLIVPPFDAAIHVVEAGETLDDIAARFGVGADAIRPVDDSTFEALDTTGRMLIVAVADARFPGLRLRVSEAPRVAAPRVRWPTDGVITQLFSAVHSGVDIAAPYGSPIVAPDAGTISAVGYRGPGGLAVCVYHDWGLETCAYHTSAVTVEVGERVVSGEPIALIGMSGVTSGPHVHWETRTNGVLVDPMTYAPTMTTAVPVGGATGSP